jgi:hypothetical protein
MTQSYLKLLLGRQIEVMTDEEKLGRYDVCQPCIDAVIGTSSR